MKDNPYYKLGYLKGAIGCSIEMLEAGATDEAIRRLKDAITTVCDHKNIKEARGSYCVVDFYCKDCGAWMGDKDVS